MNFEKEKQIFKLCGEMLITANYEMPLEDLVALISSIETQLWRARITIEYKLNKK